MTSNVYTKAIDTLAAEKEYNSANVKKIARLKMLSADKEVFAALKANNVDVKRFNARALYATEKCVNIVYQATRENLSIADLNENAFAAIKCMLLAQKANEDLTKASIEASILTDHDVAKEKQHLVYKRKNKISAVAQVQQVIDMLHTLNLVKTKSRNVYAVADTKLNALFTERFTEVAI